MGISVSQQTITFLQSTLLGIGLGVLYDLFRILRLIIPSGKIISFVEDIIYFLLCGVISFAFLLAVNNGIVRGYLLIGEFLGAALYYFTLGKLIYRVADKLILFFKKFLSLFYRIFLSPFVRIFRFILRILCRIASRKREKNLQKIQLNQNSLKQRHRLLFNVNKY